MKKLTLIRTEHAEGFTRGQLFKQIGEDPWLYTIERPWRNNEPNISCIPVGIYRIVYGRYNKGNYPCYEIPNVEGRSLIKIHIANRARELRGCIAVGCNLWSHNAISNSKLALEKFIDYMKGEEGELEITSKEDHRIYKSRNKNGSIAKQN